MTITRSLALFAGVLVSSLVVDGLNIGVFPGYGLNAREKEWAIGDVHFDSEVVYQMSYNTQGIWGGIRDRLNQGLKVTYVMEFFAPGSNNGWGSLNAMIDGAYDQDLRTFARLAREDGRPISLRPFHEFNGNWYPWSAYLHGQNPGKFKEAFKHVVEVVRYQENAWNVKFDLSYNIWGVNDDKNWADYYPGDEFVDRVCVSAYNRPCLEGKSYEWWGEIFSEWYYGQNFHNKPLCIAEASTSSGNGSCVNYGAGENKPAWIYDTFKKLADEFTRVVDICWFMENKEGDWDMNSNDEKRAFRDGHNYVRNKQGW